MNEVKKENKGDFTEIPPFCVLILIFVDTPDKTILVPLTNSLYVPGKLMDAEHVIVDIGTGYYVKKVCRP